MLRNDGFRKLAMTIEDGGAVMGGWQKEDVDFGDKLEIHSTRCLSARDQGRGPPFLLPKKCLIITFCR